MEKECDEESVFAVERAVFIQYGFLCQIGEMGVGGLDLQVHFFTSTARS